MDPIYKSWTPFSCCCAKKSLSMPSSLPARQSPCPIDRKIFCSGQEGGRRWAEVSRTGSERREAKEKRPHPPATLPPLFVEGPWTLPNIIKRRPLTHSIALGRRDARRRSRATCAAECSAWRKTSAGQDISGKVLIASPVACRNVSFICIWTGGATGEITVSQPRASDPIGCCDSSAPL